MEKKNLDWENIGFAYHQTDKRYVSNFKNGNLYESSIELFKILKNVKEKLI